MPPREVRSTCPYCGVGCGVIVTAENGRITGVRGDPEHPANLGRLCTKGTLLAQSVVRQGRALYPEWRARRTTARQRIGWDEALERLAERFADLIARHGPHSVAFYLSGQLLTEDYAVFNKLAKGIIGTNNVDTNSRLCMSSAVAAYKASLGADAPPACYEDLEHADLVVIAGSNLAWAHPVLYRRLEAARERRPQMRVVVIDPRRTETADGADLHLPILPGTDVALFNAVLHQLIWWEAIDRAFIEAHTSGFAALRDSVGECTPAWAARRCGVPEEKILAFAALWRDAGAVLSLYCQGLNQAANGSDKNLALINLHLATGQIGREGAGPFSLTGQPNAMGGREVGGLASLLPGHREVADPTHRAEIERLWGLPPGRIAAEPGKPAVAMFDALASGEIKAIWIVCTNPVQSLPETGKVVQALETAELVVVQEAFADTETAAYADVLLPAATWGEREGTVTNSERRISRVRASVPPPGEARPDWAIAADFGRRLAPRLGLSPALMAYPNVEAVFLEHRAATIGRDLDIGGLDYARLEALGPTQWPCPTGAFRGTARLYGDGRFATPDGRARLIPTPARSVAEPVDARFPLALLTGRLRDQWHGMSRTGRVAALFGHTPEPALSMPPDDALRRGLREGMLVRVRSRRGSLVLPLRFDPTLRSGQCFLPMHWGARSLPGSLGINALTLPAVDPRSFQPELKHAAVRVEAVEAAWGLYAFAVARSSNPGQNHGDADAVEALLALRERLHALALEARAELGEAALWASLTLLDGRCPGVLLRAAAQRPWPKSVLAALDASLALTDGQVLRYDDPARSSSRRLRLEDGCLTAARLAGPMQPLPALEWLQALAITGEQASTLGALLLAPGKPPKLSTAARGTTVCLCFGVSEPAVREALAQASGCAAERLRRLQVTLRCGTQCGSCLPALRRLAQEAAGQRHEEVLLKP
ncbi:MAG: molybdopterin-dependent oxidoreductase [Casimicrobiaceae bacterium]|nr:molybdopterin-dependent oxidoreductase [Casimicrobiaceae bacterium]MDW8312551.1 molybdopterin-dependent oxidoreductase [Burkholderiales bacterium]